jgi:SAM-dependent methyltransferase
VRPDPASPASPAGLELVRGTDEDGRITSGLARDPSTGETYPIKNGYLDLLGRGVGKVNVANLTNYAPGAGRLYEPLWRVRSLSLLTGERFPNERELDLVAELVQGKRGVVTGGPYLDLGCSSGLYSRGLPGRLGDARFVGIDIAPSMLGEAARRVGDAASLVRADAHRLPFADGAVAGVVCGGTLNELTDPAGALREARRVLAPGGRVAIMGILKARTPRGTRLQRFLGTGGIRFFEPEQLSSLLDRAGFEPDPLRTFGAVFFAGATRR